MTWRAYGQALALGIAARCPTPTHYAESQWPVWVRVAEAAARRDRASAEFARGLWDVAEPVLHGAPR